MEVTGEKRELEKKNLNNTPSPTIDSLTADREAEDRERVALDLKAGLHPLKVSLSLFSLFFVF